MYVSKKRAGRRCQITSTCKKEIGNILIKMNTCSSFSLEIEIYIVLECIVEEVWQYIVDVDQPQSVFNTSTCLWYPLLHHIIEKMEKCNFNYKLRHKSIDRRIT